MSLHRSLKTKSGALEAHRNVLTRPERIVRLSEKGAFDPTRNAPIGLPKVRSIKVAAAKKPKKAEGEADGAEGGAAPAAGAAAPAAAGKGAAAAPAAKGAAPAAAKPAAAAPKKK
jgi:small basic protein (TIGR04137 family)